MNEKRFEEKFSDLYQFLSAFIEQCYEPIPDNKVIDCFTSVDDYKKSILPQAREVLQLDPFPKNAIEQISMIWFDTPEKTKAWFSEIVAKLEKKVQEADDE